MTKFSPKLAFLVILGQAMQAYSMPCWWVSWWLWRAGCISQDTYLLYRILRSAATSSTSYVDQVDVDGSGAVEWEEFCVLMYRKVLQASAVCCVLCEVCCVLCAVFCVLMYRKVQALHQHHT